MHRLFAREGRGKAIEARTPVDMATHSTMLPFACEVATMPIYEYICNRCGHELEEFQRIDERPITTCPKCWEPSLQRLISRTSFILKGTGWYVTDYARKTDQSSAGNGDSDSKPEKKGKKKLEAGDRQADVST